MSESRPVPAAPLPLPDRSPAAPLFLWLVIQLLALSLGALRVPLSARFPPPGEQFAIHIMLVTQIVASALLFPFLMRDAKTSVMIVLTIAPFVQLASYLSAVPITRAALAALYVAAWLTTLATWRVFFRSRSAEMFSVALAVAWSVGIAIAWYVMAESRVSAGVDWATDGLFGPILGAIAQVHAPSVVSETWIGCLIVLGICTSSSVSILMQKRVAGSSEHPSSP